MASCHGYGPSWAHKRDPNIRLKLAGLWMCGLFLACSERAEQRESVPRSSLDRAGTYCVQEPGTLRVSEDSVGPLDLRLSLQRLKAVCPAARGAGISGGVSRDGKNVTVMFCRHPRAFLDFEPPDSVEDQSSDLSHIPSDARLKDVALFLRAKPTWIC